MSNYFLNVATSQTIATVVTTALLLDIGLSVSYPTVLISALTGLNNETNPNEFLRMSAVEASWMGKDLRACFELLWILF